MTKEQLADLVAVTDNGDRSLVRIRGQNGCTPRAWTLPKNINDAGQVVEAMRACMAEGYRLGKAAKP